jgi:hypothetical protein
MRPDGVTLVRLLLGVSGVAGIAVGAMLLLDRPDVLDHVAAWYAVPVLLHDALFAPVGVALGWLGARLLPPVARGPVLAGLLASAGLTLLVLPNLLRPEPHPVTLLDRDYVLGYVWGAVLVLLAVRVLRRQVRKPTRPVIGHGDDRAESRDASPRSRL